MLQEYKNIILSDLFFKPIIKLYQSSSDRYKCCDISDIQYVLLGLWRTLGQCVSGHDFIQNLNDRNLFDITTTTFFKALRSKRRLANITSLNDLLISPIQEKVHDPFASHQELKDWQIYAVDGHYQKAACHDPIYINSKGQKTHAATGHFFRLNLRNHHLSLLETSGCHLDTGKKHEHDMTIIKASTAEALRYDSSREHYQNQGQSDSNKPKVMLVWDRACIDYYHWYKLSQKGIYFTTIEKSNSKLKNCSADLCDHTDKRNEGIVISEHLVGNSNGVVMRRITYVNPLDGTAYNFITNDLDLQAYLIVAMYKQRWDIEKVYYQFKSKFQEHKSWATTQQAKKAQAIFQCILHNLALLIEEHIETKEKIHDTIAEKQEKGRKGKRRAVPSLKRQLM